MSERAGEETTIWRDGQVYRRNAWGRVRQLKDIRPVDRPPVPPAPSSGLKPATKDAGSGASK